MITTHPNLVALFAPAKPLPVFDLVQFPSGRYALAWTLPTGGMLIVGDWDTSDTAREMARKNRWAIRDDHSNN